MIFHHALVYMYCDLEFWLKFPAYLYGDITMIDLVLRPPTIPLFNSLATRSVLERETPPLIRNDIRQR